MGVSGQRHVPAALYLRGKDTRYPLDRRLDGPQSRSGHKGLCRGSNPYRPVVQSVVRHYTAWATPAPTPYYNFILLSRVAVLIYLSYYDFFLYFNDLKFLNA
jgi:hypothetical protein